MACITLFISARLHWTHAEFIGRCLLALGLVKVHFNRGDCLAHNVTILSFGSSLHSAQTSALIALHHRRKACLYRMTRVKHRSVDGLHVGHPAFSRGHTG